MAAVFSDVRFSNRPFGVKRFQTIHHHSVDVAHGLVLLCANMCTCKILYLDEEIELTSSSVA